jgi:transglutaminase-like putative cysteine protease
MSVIAALQHVTRYRYDPPVALGPQIIRLRPAPHCRTPILSYSLKVEPAQHFVNWQQDPSGNWLARFVFPERTSEFSITVDVLADMSVINPFDFFVDPVASQYPFVYPSEFDEELAPYLVREPAGPLLTNYVKAISRKPQSIIDFIVGLNQQLQSDVRYLVRLDPGVQTMEDTLTLQCGSCRDSAWLMVQILRHLGLAARFVSGYLIQLRPDIQSIDGPVGAADDFCDLHAWAEVYLPGAGWIGLDATSGLLTGEGHLPLAATPHYRAAAPISGGVEAAKVDFSFSMTVTRVEEKPRITRSRPGPRSTRSVRGSMPTSMRAKFA